MASVVAWQTAWAQICAWQLDRNFQCHEGSRAVAEAIQTNKPSTPDRLACQLSCVQDLTNSALSFALKTTILYLDQRAQPQSLLQVSTG